MSAPLKEVRSRSRVHILEFYNRNKKVNKYNSYGREACLRSELTSYRSPYNYIQKEDFALSKNVYRTCCSITQTSFQDSCLCLCMWEILAPLLNENASVYRISPLPFPPKLKQKGRKNVLRSIHRKITHLPTRTYSQFPPLSPLKKSNPFRRHETLSPGRIPPPSEALSPSLV